MAGSRAASRRRATGAGLALALAMPAMAACTVGSSSPASAPDPASPTASSTPSTTRASHRPKPKPSAAPKTATPSAAPAPPAEVRAGHNAWVSVSVARLWESPTSPRTVDRPALAAPVRFREWLGAMTLTERRDLSSYSDTEALMDERVVVRRVSGTWADVVVPDQPSQKDPGGYPGWVPLRQLTGSAPTPTSLVATVVRPTAWLRRDNAADAQVTEISSGTTLPVIGRVAHYVRVQAPRGDVRRISASDAVVHRPGAAALPPHSGVLDTAKNYLGLAYLWGGLSGFGIDCSGLTWLSNRLHGTLIPRDALPQSQHGTTVSRSALAPGDLIFYATAGLVHHVTMYAGSGQMIEAPHTGAFARIVPVSSDEYYGARRY